MLKKWLAVITVAAYVTGGMGIGTVLAESVLIPAGTVVPLQILTNVSPRSHNAGDPVQLTVVSDVVVGGKTVIPVGSIALGMVSQSSMGNLLGIPGEIFMQVTSVNGPKGSTIPVMTSKNMMGSDRIVVSVVFTILCLFGFIIRGGTPMIPAGTVVNAITISPITVDVP